MVLTAEKELVLRLESTLESNQIDYRELVKEFGQVEASEKRRRNEVFNFDDHLRGFIMALLSNQRPWGPIAKNKSTINELFYNYSPEKLEQADYKELVSKIKNIHCGNRSIEKQLKHLQENILTFRKIILEWKSLDVFVTSQSAEETAKILSDPKSSYKIKQLGFTLAMEYLRNVGIRGMKPDLHLLRICGHERLGLFPEKTKPEQAALLFNEFAKKAEANPVYLDNLFWIFGAQDYANICNAQPKCHLCSLRNKCNYHLGK